MSSEHIEIRPIEVRDNEAVEKIIHETLTSFNAVGEGYSIHDAENADMYKMSSLKGAAYFVAVENGVVLGGAGLSPLLGREADICELKKMYLIPTARGKGLGKRLFQACIEEAQRQGYKKCYLETLRSMVAANALYQKSGFLLLGGPLGETGHFSCDAWYVKDL
ncbi:MAG: GNAT family N-acetyltransferase [Alphaproteobacteria bacterium]